MAARKPTVVSRATISQVADLNQIDAFVKVMDAGSFTAAARALGLPKSSLSRAVSKLERRLGVLLIQRTTRKLMITEAGRQYLEQARAALALLSDAQASLREEGEPRGLVRLTAAPDTNGFNYAEPIARFVRRYPGIQVEMVFTQRRVDMVAEGIDLAVRAGRVDDNADLVGRRLGSTPFCLIASPAYLAERGTPSKLAALAEHECVLFRGLRGTQRWTLTRGKRVEHVQVRGSISVDEISYVRHLAIAGVGIGFVPKLLVRDALLEGRLVHVLPQYSEEGSAIYLVHPATPHLPRRVALLRDHLYAELKARFAEC